MQTYWREMWAVAQRLLIELLRRRRSLIFWAVFPIAILVLNALILEERAQISRAEAFSLAAPPTLVGAALFFSCLGGSVATVVAEREQGTLKRLFISPLRGLTYFLGIFIAHCWIGLAQTLLVAALTVAMGGTLAGWLPLALLLVVLSIVAYVGVGFLLGTQLARRTEDVNALVAAFGVPLLILGGAFLPTSLFPESLLRIARFNPIFHMTEALAAVLVTEPSWEQVAEHFWFLLGFAIAMAITGWLAYRRMVQTERQL